MFLPVNGNPREFQQKVERNANIEESRDHVEETKEKKKYIWLIDEKYFKQI